MSNAYNSILKDLLKSARDVLRTDDNLVSTILNIPGGTVNAKNYIFAQRPVDQKQGFVNPRIVFEAEDHQPNKYGNNPDGFQQDNLLFQISIWVDENPWSTAIDAVDRIRTLLDETDFTTTEGGAGSFEVTSTGSDADPDKENTTQGRVLVSARLITQG